MALILTTPLSFFSSTGTAQEHQADSAIVAMWVWDARIVVESRSSRKLINFCRSHGIKTIYLSAYRLDSPMDQVYAKFNTAAHRAGLQVHALAGDPRWGRTRYHHLPLQWVQSIQDFNRSARQEERFDGVHTDIEVYLLVKSWRETPALLLGGYLDLNAKIAGQLQAPEDSLFFGVDIPFWFDDDKNYRIAWQGKVKSPSQHILDTVDGATVMAYRNFAEGPDGTVQLVLLELNYADQVGKKIVIGQETQENLHPAYVSFGGTSCGQMMSVLKKIEQTVGGHASFDGFAVHHYESYAKLCQ
jgi:hypothetical protein